MYKADYDDLPQDNNFFRVYIHPVTNATEVTCIGMNCVDSDASGNYDTLSSVPTWMQRKIAVLKFMGKDRVIEHIGRMLDDDTFWVFEE